mgnify:CR=1 FL=1
MFNVKGAKSYFSLMSFFFFALFFEMTGNIVLSPVWISFNVKTYSSVTLGSTVRFLKRIVLDGFISDAKLQQRFFIFPKDIFFYAAREAYLLFALTTRSNNPSTSFPASKVMP